MSSYATRRYATLRYALSKSHLSPLDEIPGHAEVRKLHFSLITNKDVTCLDIPAV
jgi:hypothetical protein